MSGGIPKEAIKSLADLKAYCDEVLRKDAERGRAETVRRANLTPEQRAKEDRDVIFRKYHAMGIKVLGRESWTLDHFSRLLMAELPTKQTLWVSNEQSEIKAVLESCVGVSLQPINRNLPLAQWRFPTTELIKVSVKKSLKYAALLNAMFGVANPDQKEIPLAARAATRPATWPATRRRTAGAKTPKNSNWRALIAEIVARINEATNSGQFPEFDPAALPFSPKALYGIVSDLYGERNIENLPINVDTFRKYMNSKYGWKAKAGFQKPDANRRLKSLFHSEEARSNATRKRNADDQALAEAPASRDLENGS